MYFSKLAAREKEIVHQCMNAILNSGFLFGEFHPRMGISEKTLEHVIAKFPGIDDADDESDETLAINNSLNEICHGLAFTDEEWQKWFTVEKKYVVKTYKKWRRLRGWQTGGIK